MKLPQLTLRDLFWLVALVAIGCGWWVRERQLAPLEKRNHLLERWLQMAKRGGFEFYHEESEDNHIHVQYPSRKP